MTRAALALAGAALAAACGDGQRDGGGGGETSRSEQRDAEIVEPASVELGARLYRQEGCAACHSIDGSSRTGPSLLGAASRAREGTTRFADGTLARDVIGPGKPYPAVRDYLIAEMLRPNERIVADYPPVAVSYDGQLAPHELDALVLFIESLVAEQP